MSREDLIAKGFSSEIVDEAIAATDGSTYQCMNWIYFSQGMGLGSGAQGGAGPGTHSGAGPDAGRGAPQTPLQAAVKSHREEIERGYMNLNHQEDNIYEQTGAGAKRKVAGEHRYPRGMPKRATQDRPAQPGQLRMRIKYNGQSMKKIVDKKLMVEDFGKELAGELGLAPGSFVLETVWPKSRIAVRGNTASVYDAGLSSRCLFIVLV